MTPVRGVRMRVDIKFSPRGNGMSPLDKDRLKLKCLERVRSERHLLMSKLRKRGSPGEWADTSGEEIGRACGARTGVIGGLDLGKIHMSTPKEILEYSLHRCDTSLIGGKGCETSSCNSSSPFVGHGPICKERIRESVDMGLMDQEENAYRYSCGMGGGVRLEYDEFDDAKRSQGGEVDTCHDADSRHPISTNVEAEVHRESGDPFDDDFCETGRILSPEEYEEMMMYIEEALREEGIQAEGEALEQYEIVRRMEEEELESAVISHQDDIDHAHGEDAVLCPICKHDWLVQGGPPSGAILCRCGFRLDTGDEGLSLGHLKQQLSDTYTQHRCQGWV